MYYGLLQAFTNIWKLKINNSQTNPPRGIPAPLAVGIPWRGLKKRSPGYIFSNPITLLSKGLYFDNNSLFSKRKVSLQFVRFNSTDTYSIIKELYKDRLAPVKLFNDKTILSVSNILDLAQRAEFFNQLKNIGKGIYLIQYQNDPLVYYIGRTNNFEYRFKTHLNRKLSDKFHVFANIVGWDNFTISIVELCETIDLGIRENYYLQKYLPLLNSTFSSASPFSFFFLHCKKKKKRAMLNIPSLREGKF